MNRIQSAFLSTSFLLAATLIASNAAAAPVDNPGTFTLTWPQGAPVFLFGPAYGTDATGSVITFDLDAAGAIDTSTASGVIDGDIPTFFMGASVVHAQYLVSGISGYMDAATGGATITIQGRIRFTASGISGSCLTPIFTVTTSPVNGTMMASPVTNVTMSKGIVIPAIPTGGTCSATTIINSTLGLGSRDASVEIYKAVVDPPIKGS